MPIINLQQRYVQVGTIRIGAKTETSSGKMRPTAIDKFRFTSDNPELLRRISLLYGGEVHPFDEPRSTDRWEVFSDTDVIEVLVPNPGPGRSVISQWYEKWSAGGCTHRCDGIAMSKCDGRDVVDAPCQCTARGLDPTDGDHCDAHTRLNVVIPGAGVIGVWRLNTGSWNAAEEMLGMAAGILDRGTSLGYAMPCTLSIQKRERRTLEDGKPVTKKFVVPVLSPDLDEGMLRRIAAGLPYNPLENTEVVGGAPVAAVGMPTAPALPAGGVRADRASTGRIRAVPADVAVPPTGAPLPGGPIRRTGGAKSAAFILGLPESFQGKDAATQEKRHALYALAAGRDGVDFADLDGAQLARVADWAKMVDKGTAQLVINLGAYEILGNDGDALVVARHQGGLEERP